MKVHLEVLEYKPARKSRPGGWQVKKSLQFEVAADKTAMDLPDDARRFMETNLGTDPQPGKGFSVRILP